jgi:hypothetical protein
MIERHVVRINGLNIDDMSSTEKEIMLVQCQFSIYSLNF